MELKGKKILVVGLGKSGVAAALFLRRAGAQVTVSDQQSATKFAQEIPALLEAGVAVETGGHGLLTFRRQDLILVSPGVPFDTPELVQVRSFGLPIMGEIELASRYLKGKILAITGSNGKTTTTSLCGEIFQASGQKTLIGGNIGVPVIALVGESSVDSWSVLEVSSFQLETTSSFHPRIAVILNITPDHLDRHGTFANYAAMKEKIFAQQNESDALILNGDDAVVQSAASRAHSRIFWFSRTKIVQAGACIVNEMVVFRPSDRASFVPILPVSEIPLKGTHNVENVLAAVCAASVGEVSPEVIARAVASFHAVEHRLEFVATIQGVDYYNDSKATNVDAAAKAIASFPEGIHLILGGKDKDSDYGQLIPLLRKRVKSVYLIGSAAEKIARQIGDAIPLVQAGTLKVALRQASQAAVAGEIVLLAPACSSFDQFENYEHRGRAFKELVQARRKE